MNHLEHYKNHNPISALLADQSLRNKYFQQARNAAHRGIGFHLTHEEWLYIWLSSGHLHERGKGINSYCMARFNDRGDYEVGNVEIIPHRQNSFEGSHGKPKAPEHREKLAAILHKIRQQTPVIIKGKKYVSISAAAKKLGCTRTTVKKRVESSLHPDWKYAND